MAELMLNNPQNVPIFIVNLKRAVDRKKQIQQICKEYNLNVEFIEAVDGSLLNKEEIECVYSETKTIEKIGRSLSKGEIGCALSHLAIYQKMLKENIKQAIIFEDDIVLN